MYKRILIVVDQRAVTRAAVKEGVAIATAHDADVVSCRVTPCRWQMCRHSWPFRRKNSSGPPWRWPTSS